MCGFPLIRARKADPRKFSAKFSAIHRLANGNTAVKLQVDLTISQTIKPDARGRETVNVSV